MQARIDHLNGPCKQRSVARINNFILRLKEKKLQSRALTRTIDLKTFPCFHHNYTRDILHADGDLVGHSASAAVAVFVRFRVRLRSPDQSRHHVHHERSETGVHLQQHHPRPVHADIFVFRQQRDVRHIQPGIRRGRERRDFFRGAARHRGPSTQPRGCVARHKRNNRVLLHKHLALHRRTDHISTGK